MKESRENYLKQPGCACLLYILLFFMLTFLLCFALDAILQPKEVTYKEDRWAFLMDMFYVSISYKNSNGDNKQTETIETHRIIDYIEEHEKKDFDIRKFKVPVVMADQHLYIPKEDVEKAKALVRDRLSSVSAGPAELKLISEDGDRQLWELSYWRTFAHISFRYESTKNTLTPISYKEHNFGIVLRHLGISMIISFVSVLITCLVLKKRTNIT